MSGKRLLAGLALALFPLALFAQITVKVQPPPANQLKFDDLWSVEIANTAERTFNVYLKAELSAITPDNRVEPVAKAVSGNFKLPSGTKKLTRADIAEVKNTWFKPGFEEMLNAGNLPTGAYQIEATVLTTGNDEMAWDHIVVSTAPPSPPHLIAPTDAEVLLLANPTFEWSAPVPLSPDAQVTYSLKIVELLPGQSTEEALRNPSWFEEPSLTLTSLVYPAEAKPFVKGAHYYWQVRGTVNGVDVGISETWSFSPAPEIAEIDLGRRDIVAALDLTMTAKVRQDLQALLIKFDDAKDALDKKDAKLVLKSENEALKGVNDILNRAGKSKESTEFIDKLRSARRKLEAEIEAAKVK